jgi:hypothetical protein
MATQQEKNAVLELVDLAMAINDQGRVSVDFDITASSVHLRISKVPFVKDQGWLFYGEHDAYFSTESFSEESFLRTIGGFVAEAKKHHNSFDADGVKL